MAHNIEFSQFDVMVMQIGSPGIPPQVLTTWTIEPIRSSSTDVLFSVQRSQTPNFSDLDAIETLDTMPFVFGQSVYEYLDVTVNMQSFWRQYFYRVTATDVTAGKPFYTVVKSWESDPKVFELEIVARHDFLLRYETGTPCFALIERTSGSNHCQLCYNESLQRSEKSNCPVCFGTGRERPYYQPILTFIDFNPSPNMTNVTEQGEVQVGQVNVWWSAYPRLKPGDILVEVVSGERWRINTVNPLGTVRTAIHNFGSLNRVNQRDAEHRIAIPEGIQRMAMIELDRMKAERRF